MHAEPNELILYLNSSKKEDRAIRAYALTLNHHKLNERDLAHEQITQMQLAGIASDLNVSIHGLLDPGVDTKHHDFDEETLLSMMARDHSLIRTPIAYLDDRTFFVESEFQLIREEM